MDTEANKKVVLGFYRTAFEEKDPDKALSAFGGDYYRQHNPNVPDGKDGFVAYAKARVAKNPGRKLLFKRVFVNGDYVVLHIHHVFAPSDEAFVDAPHGMAGVDIFSSVLKTARSSNTGTCFSRCPLKPRTTTRCSKATVGE